MPSVSEFRRATAPIALENVQSLTMPPDGGHPWALYTNGMSEFLSGEQSQQIYRSIMYTAGNNGFMAFTDTEGQTTYTRRPVNSSVSAQQLLDRLNSVEFVDLDNEERGWYPTPSEPERPNSWQQRIGLCDPTQEPDFSEVAVEDTIDYHRLALLISTETIASLIDPNQVLMHLFDNQRFRDIIYREVRNYINQVGPAQAVAIDTAVELRMLNVANDAAEKVVNILRSRDYPDLDKEISILEGQANV